MGRSTTWMVVLTLWANAVNYASSVVFSRLLSPAAYGDLTALFALSVIASVPAVAAQTVIGDRLATLAAQGKDDEARLLIRHATGRIGTIAAVAGLAYLACVPLVERGLHLGAVGPALALAPLLALTFVLPLANGFLLGYDRFVALGLVALAVAASRLVIGVPWILAGGGAGAPLLGQAIGYVAVIVAIGWFMRARIAGPGTRALRSGLRRRIGPAAVAASVAFVLFALVQNLDLLLAKLVLSSTEGGLYAALTTAGKIVFFLPGAVSAVMVPSAARARLTQGSGDAVLRVAGGLVLATTLVVALPMALEPHLVLDTMFGSKYTGVSAAVLPIVWANGALALLYLVVIYTVAVGDRRWVLVLAGGLTAQCGAFAAFHSSPTEIATVQAILVTAMLITNELLFQPIFLRRAGR
jgi:O-antigen/teichoic acid export membrane protein